MKIILLILTLSFTSCENFNGGSISFPTKDGKVVVQVNPSK